ncbi:2719_t:CDS:2 [Gigaspora margarita]|uniref:2719_t:CDS:1 n=1 Tax=Gigaspora margarita TaxID=4874 RepID=A0ABN7UF33_GIGMA|nr:2719_t:CDS:2 [Gigaspora margarita]
MYGTIRKESMTIDELYKKILRIGRQANYRPEKLCRKFLDALPLPWLKKAENISEHLPLNELAKKLYEIELRRIARHKRDRISDPLVSHDNLFDGPPLPHKPDKLRSARIDRLESIIGKVANTVGSVADSVGQLTNQLGRMTLNDQSRKPFYCSVPEPNKNQFRIKLHGKTYVIPTYSKVPIAKEPPKEEQESSSQIFANSSNPTSENFKKNAKILKNVF